MSVVCLFAEHWKGGGEGLEGVVDRVVAVAPRVVVEAAQGRIWLDGWGLDAVVLAETVLERIREEGGKGARGGVALTPVGAWAGAVHGEEGVVERIAPGMDREYLVDLPLTVLEPPEALLTLLDGVGITHCGALAALEREAVEVRFGASAVPYWRLARADDTRRLFPPPSRELPQASLDFVDYMVMDPERLLFTVHALLGNVCEALAVAGWHARRLLLTLPLANGQVWRRVLRTARPTASRPVWLRLARGLLEKLTVADAVTGVGVQVESVEAATAIQGDLFDAGFATAGAVDAALARLLDLQGSMVVRPERSAHPLPERRTTFVPDPQFQEATRDSPMPPATARLLPPASRAPTGLTLQLLPEPRRVEVEAIPRRDHLVPVRYRDGDWHSLVTVAGPERISGGQWEEPYAREYFRGVTGAGSLVWLYRDARQDRWYLHGWWD